MQEIFITWWMTKPYFALRRYEQNLFHMQAFISTREAEADFSSQRERVLSQMEAVNKILIANCMKISPMTGF